MSDAGTGAAGDGGASGDGGTAAGGGSPSNRRLWTAVIFLNVALVGAAMQARGAILPTLESVFAAPEWQLGLVAAAGTLGYLTVILAVGSKAGSLDARTYIVGGLVGSALALLGMAVAPTFLVFLLGITARSAMIGVVRALDRPLLSHFYPDDRGRIYNFYDMIWAVGAAAGPLLVVALTVGPVRLGGLTFGSWRLVYVVLAVAVVAVAVLFWRLDAPTVESNEEPLDRESVGRLLRRPEVMAMMAALFFSTCVEGGLFTWLPYYARGELPAGLAGVTLTVMLLAYIPGRLFAGTFGERIGYLTLLVGLVVALIPAFLFTFVVVEGLALLAGVAVIGLLVSGLYPTLMAYATDAVPEYSGPINALAAAMGGIGVAAAPAAMGVIIGSSNAATAMQLLVVPLVGVLAVLGLAHLGHHRRDRTAPADAGADD